jgi:hypothetical protein
LVLLSLDGLLIIIKCLTVLPIGKWFDYSCRYRPRIFLLFAPYLILKEKEKLFNKIIMSSTLRRSVLKGIIAEGTMGIPMRFLILH